MKRNKIIILVSSLLVLSSCSFNKKIENKPSYEEFEKVLNEFKEETNIEKKYESYKEIEAIIAKTERFKGYLVTKPSYFANLNEDSSYLHNLYIKENYYFYLNMQKALEDSSFLNFMINKEGENKINFIKDLSLSSSYYIKNDEVIDISSLENLKEEVNNSILNKDVNIACEKLENISSLITKMNEKAPYDYIKYALDTKNDESLDLYSSYSSKITEYHDFILSKLKEMFDKGMKEETIKKLNLSSNDILNIEEYKPLSEKALSLTKEENEVCAKYSKFPSNLERKKTFLELVNIRQALAKEMGYSSYLDYAFERIYNRDYSKDDALRLCSNILENKKVHSLFEKLGMNSNNKYYDETKIDKYLIDENDIFNSLNLCDNVVPLASKIKDEMRALGLYNFEKRDNKLASSFVINLSNSNFMFVNGEGNLKDLSTCFHEFGHYLGFSLFDEENITSSESLEVCEMDSQSLQYLMNNFIGDIIPQSLIKDYINYSTFLSLWTIESSIAIYELEYYVYTTPNLTLNSIDLAFDTYIEKTTYPFSFGWDENNQPIYTPVIHLYESPGYYISYLTSLIPSLEIYSFPLEKGKETYNKLIEHSPYNGYKDTLKYLGLSSIDNKDKINDIIDYLDKTVIAK